MCRFTVVEQLNAVYFADKLMCILVASYFNCNHTSFFITVEPHTFLLDESTTEYYSSILLFTTIMHFSTRQLLSGTFLEHMLNV